MFALLDKRLLALTVHQFYTATSFAFFCKLAKVYHTHFSSSPFFPNGYGHDQDRHSSTIQPCTILLQDSNLFQLLKIFGDHNWIEQEGQNLSSSVILLLHSGQFNFSPLITCTP